GCAIFPPCQLPVGIYCELMMAIACFHPLIHPLRTQKLCPALCQRGNGIQKLGCITAQIDKNDAKPDKRPYLSQTMVFTFETFIGVFVHTTDMRGTFQVSVQIISPGVVWADHDSGTLPFFMNQLHAPVTTDIMKDFYLILVIA